MQIIVDGREAVLKEGSSFDFIAENRLFSGSDSYTLTIVFPLKDCPNNIEIFGQIHRSEIVPQDVTFNCEIRDKAFSRFGALTVTEISDIELKAQFLEGRAEQNFSKKFDETFVNELDLGTYPMGIPSTVSPQQAWNPENTDWEAVALPWVSADSGVSHNFADYDGSSGTYSWISDVRALSWQPYLIHIVKKICEAVGYTYDFSEWEEDLFLSRLLVCNTLPDSWDLPGYARILPHWTVDEFLEKLELFLRGEFEIDHRACHISFRFSNAVLENTPPVLLGSVVDEYSSSIDTESSKCEYLEAKPFRYCDQSLQIWKYQSCDWFLKTWPEDSIVRYPDFNTLYEDNKGRLTHNDAGGNHRGQSATGNIGKVLYDESDGLYFVFRNISRTENGKDDLGRTTYIYRRIFQPINEFGAYLPDGTELEDAEDIEFIPACVDFTEEKYGNVLFLSFSSYNESASTMTSSGVNILDSFDDDSFQKTGLQNMIESGEQESRSEYYDVVNLGYYAGYYPTGALPYPRSSSIGCDKDGKPSAFYAFSLRINDPNDQRWTPYYSIDRTRKVTFKFLSDDIPNPRAMFYIHGRRYICEKITATFTEDGMSQLLKGEFWPLLDD